MIGKTLGHYQITEKIGAGGMGVVYKARDLHLDRFVALKILPPEKVADRERKRRFVQEAKASSALNHPNIVHVYDIDQSDGTDYIAMEYVEGKTLDQRIGYRGMRLSDALKYAVQIADALSKAHSAGIVHRDLKPTNIMVNEDGVVKVLDFGLAKLTEEVQGDETASTATVDSEGRPITEEGVIVGTVSYMSPEQAEGKRVDARSDIFSLGSVLYEMVTGQKAFQGTSKLSTLSAILHQEPKAVSGITPTIPADLEKLINRCLRKDPSKRLQHMDDVKLALDELKEDSDSGRLQAAPARARQFTPMRLIAFAVAVIAVIGSGWYWLHRQSRPESEAPLMVAPLTSYPGDESSPSFSPDGNQVAFSWNSEKEDNYDIYVKLIGSPKSLRLTTDPAWDGNPAFSPDGSSIAFIRRGPGEKARVFLTSPLGPPERRLAEITQTAALTWGTTGGLAWTPDGKSLVITDRDAEDQRWGLFLLSVDSGEKRRLSSAPEERVDIDPAFSPDGRTLAFSREGQGVSDIHLLSVSQDFQPIGEPKRLTFENQLTRRPVWTSDASEIVFSSGTFSNFSLFWIASSGSGKPRRLAGCGEDGSEPSISCHGHRLAYTRALTDVNIWRLEVPGTGGKTNSPMRFISSTRFDGGAQFSPDGKKIVFSSDRSGSDAIWVCDDDGSNPVRLTLSAMSALGSPRWSPDGERVAFDSNVDGQWEVYVIGVDGGKPKRLTHNSANDFRPCWSGDGEWIYFRSNRSGESQIWKMPSGGGEAVQVTRNGGYEPVESPDGKWLYYCKGEMASSLWRVSTEGGEESQVLESVFLRGFAVVKEGIYFIPRPDSASRCSIQFFDAATTRTRLIATIEKPVRWRLSVSPDGRWILYSQVDEVGSDLMLVENFR